MYARPSSPLCLPSYGEEAVCKTGVSARGPDGAATLPSVDPLTPRPHATEPLHCPDVPGTRYMTFC